MKAHAIAAVLLLATGISCQEGECAPAEIILYRTTFLEDPAQAQLDSAEANLSGASFSDIDTLTIEYEDDAGRRYVVTYEILAPARQ